MGKKQNLNVARLSKLCQWLRSIVGNVGFVKWGEKKSKKHYCCVFWVNWSSHQIETLVIRQRSSQSATSFIVITARQKQDFNSSNNIWRFRFSNIFLSDTLNINRFLTFRLCSFFTRPRSARLCSDQLAAVFVASQTEKSALWLANYVRPIKCLNSVF